MTARSVAFARFFALLLVFSSYLAPSMARIEVGYIGEIPNGE
jgi:hypothetical protein